MRRLRLFLPSLLLLAALAGPGFAARFPLLSTLSVEFATLAAFPLFSVGLWFGAVVARKTAGWTSTERLFGVFLPGTLAVAGFATLPFLIGYAVSPDIRICSTTLPYEIYYFIAGGAALTGFYWSFAASLLFPRRVHRFWFLLFIIGYSVVFSVLDFGWGSRLAPLNPVLGFLPFYGVASSGTIPPVAWSHRIFYFGLITSVIALALAAKADSHRERRAKTLLLATFSPLLVILLVLALTRRDVGGFLPGTLRLSEFLSQKVESDHIKLSYHPGSFTPEEVSRNLGILEWAYRKNAVLLPPRSGRKVLGFLYREDEKWRLTGAEDILFAAPPRYAIHITDAWDPNLLRHELAHTMAAPYGLPLIGVPLSLPMTEGLADAVSQDYAVSPEAHAIIAASLKNNALPPASSFMTNLGFLKLHTRLSYAFSGSFLGFLIYKYGPQPVLASYGGKRLSEAIGKPLNALDQEWRTFLAEIPVPPEEQKVARDYYNPRTVKPFFSNLCPRDRSLMNAQLRLAITMKQFDTAENLIQTYSQRDPGNPDWLSARVTLLISRRYLAEAETLLQQMDRDGVPSFYLVRGWRALRRLYEDEWLKSPESPTATERLERALLHIANLEYGGPDALIIPLQLKVIRESPPDPALYRALNHICEPSAYNALSRKFKGHDLLAWRVVALQCNHSALSLKSFLELQPAVAQAEDPVLARIFRENLLDWVQGLSPNTQYEDIVRGYRLLMEISPPSRKRQYQTALELAEFLHAWTPPE